MLDDEEIAYLAKLYSSQLAARRRTYDKTCPVCMAHFEAISKAKYCSQACRQKAWRARNPDYKPTQRGTFKSVKSVERFLNREKRATNKVYEDMELNKKLRKIER